MPPNRPLLLPPQQRRKRQPLQLLQQRSFRTHDRPSCLRPFIEPQQRPLLALHLHPDPHPVLVSLRLPVLLPQRLSCLRPQQHLFPAPKQFPFRPTFQHS